MTVGGGNAGLSAFKISLVTLKQDVNRELHTHYHIIGDKSNVCLKSRREATWVALLMLHRPQPEINLKVQKN